MIEFLYQKEILTETAKNQALENLKHSKEDQIKNE
jgi:hypothetical protein